MIRPFTCLCMLAAAGSGLYLYQTKHRAQVLDQQIDQVLRAADANRDRMRVLRTEYQLLQDPSRMEDLANQHLALVKTDPKQFINWATFEHNFPIVAMPASVAASPDDARRQAPLTAAGGEAYGPPRPAATPAPTSAPPASAPPNSGAPASASGLVAGNEPASPPAVRPASPAIAEPKPAPIRETGPAAAPTVLASAAPVPRSAPGMAHAEISPAPLPPARAAAPAPQRVMMTTPRRVPYMAAQPASAEPAGRFNRFEAPPPALPPMGSALGMARTLSSPTFIPPASGSGWISSGNGG